MLTNQSFTENMAVIDGKQYKNIVCYLSQDSIQYIKKSINEKVQHLVQII